MRRPLLHPAHDERGFILVGVVTFMLALTILGLSLFALSSYEAQFFFASASREQSLQNAESGMELVKALLASPTARLQDANLAVGEYGVTHAMAYQWRSGVLNDTTSSGLVNWDSTMVIVVSAKSGGVERTLQAKFMPGVVDNPYKRLIASGAGVTYNTEFFTNPAAMRMNGLVWHPVRSAADSAWTQYVTWAADQPLKGDTPPLPEGDAFVDGHWLTATDVPPDPNNTHLAGQSGYELDNKGRYRITLVNPDASPSAAPVIFRSPPSVTDNHPTDDTAEYPFYSFYANATLQVEVRGTVVWLVPQGADFKGVLEVVPDSLLSGPGGTLILVAKAGTDPAAPNRGLWLQSGLYIGAKVNVFLVTEGGVSLTHHLASGNTQGASATSIVAGGGVEIGGPQLPAVFTLRHATAMDALADQLLAQGALPPLGGGAGASFTALRSFWAETTPR